MTWLDALAADLVLIVHFGFVAFVVFGLPLIWLGAWRRWHFVRNVWFRGAHLAAIGFVAMESLAGVVCPLTTWENQLRLRAGGGAYAESFVQHWVHRVLFYEGDERVFTVLYILFFCTVLASLWLVAPQWPCRRSTAR